MDQIPYRPLPPPTSTDMSSPDVLSQATGAGAALRAFARAHNLGGSVARALELGASGDLTREVAAAIAEQVPAQERAAYLDIILNAIFFAIEQSLANHPLTTDELSNLLRLQRLFGIGEGDLLAHSSTRVAAILQGEMARLLADRHIEPAEALYQVDLQKLLGLTYDEYRQLTRSVADSVVDEIIGEITADGIVTAEERLQLERQLIALDTFYILTPERRALLAGAGFNLTSH